MYVYDKCKRHTIDIDHGNDVNETAHNTYIQRQYNTYVPVMVMRKSLRCSLKAWMSTAVSNKPATKLATCVLVCVRVHKGVRLSHI